MGRPFTGYECIGIGIGVAPVQFCFGIQLVVEIDSARQVPHKAASGSSYSATAEADATAASSHTDHAKFRIGKAHLVNVIGISHKRQLITVFKGAIGSRQVITGVFIGICSPSGRYPAETQVFLIFFQYKVNGGFFFSVIYTGEFRPV
ncbi:hypothetical protein FQZ97_868310 [compost metagenome]